MKKLQIETMVLGPVSTNCYLAINKENQELFLVDPADHAAAVSEQIDRLKAVPKAILLTHGHFDHIGAAADLAQKYQIPIYAHKKEKEVLQNPEINLSVGMGRMPIRLEADHETEDQEILLIAGFEIQVIATPGHTCGGVCYYLPAQQVLFSGDTLFCGSVGRTDLPTGSMKQLHASVHEKLFVLPEETLVYPGHGEMTDIQYEKQYNPY